MNLKAIDLAIAEKVMGWRLTAGGLKSRGLTASHYFSTPNGERRISTFRPSEDISAAWQVVEKLMGRAERPALLFEMEIITESLGVRFRTPPEQPEWTFSGSTEAPLAICLAALQALGVEIPE